MSSWPAPPAESAVPSENRILGRIQGSRPGPTLLCVGGLHGNESAGVEALERVLARLEGEGNDLAGDFVALVGNRAALARGRRFLSQDLNRLWTPDRLRDLEAGRLPGPGEESLEQLDLFRAIRRVTALARGPVYALDLHTTSSTSGPWATVEDTLPNRSFALSFPVPLVLGLEEQVEGTLLDYLSHSGFLAMGFEGGQHRDPASVDRLESAIWVGLESAGLLSGPRMPVTTRAHRRLRSDTRSLPRVLEMRYRHPIRSRDAFRMRPGFVNLQPVRSGEPLARDREGEIRAPEAGRLLMPLYQEQGEDGFFVVREFRPFWLHVSAALRHLGLGRVVHWLPGIRRHPDSSDALIVDRRWARWFALEVLHLLGFRKERDEGRILVVQRRRRSLD